MTDQYSLGVADGTYLGISPEWREYLSKVDTVTDLVALATRRRDLTLLVSSEIDRRIKKARSHSYNNGLEDGYDRGFNYGWDCRARSVDGTQAVKCGKELLDQYAAAPPGSVTRGLVRLEVDRRIDVAQADSWNDHDTLDVQIGNK